MQEFIMIADVYIELKEGVADPEGEATLKALRLLGFKRVKKVASVKVFRIDIEARSKEEAEKEIAEMCEKLLANPVIQKYSIVWRE
nr:MULTISPECIES: phosphoribosylformylglycinamidine synthase subunit PurS [unclassified Archaeoglobus]